MKLLVITQKYDINDSNLGAFVGWWDKLAEKIEKVYVLTLEKHSEPTLSNIKVLSMGKEKGVDFFGKIALCMRPMRYSASFPNRRADRTMASLPRMLLCPRFSSAAGNFSSPLGIS